MVRCHRFLLAHFLWIVLLIPGIASRLPAQEGASFPPTHSVPDPATPLTETPATLAEGQPSELIEINDANPPTSPTEKPTLEELLAQWDRYRKAHVPYHVRYRETIRPQSAREAKLMVALGYRESREFVAEIEFALWNDRWWRRLLTKRVDGKTLPTTIAPLNGAEYKSAKEIPHPEAFSAVFYEPFPKDCSLDFDGPYPHITVKGEFPGEKIEIWMMPASRWWFPKRIKQVIDGTKHEDEFKDVVGAEWEVKHFRTFGTNRAPEIIDGVHREIYLDGDEQTVITTEWAITKLLLGEKVVPGEIAPSLAPMPAPPATAPTADRAATKTDEIVALTEFAGKTTPTTELQAPGLEHLLNQLEAFRKAHTPFHLRHREAIKVRNASEAKVIETMGFAPGRLLDTEFESAFWDNRSWKRCLGHGVDGEQASDKHLGGDHAGTAGLIVPLPLLGVLLEPKPENCQLTFEGPLPRITFTTYERKDHFELWMLPVSGQWIPKRLRISAEAKDEPVLEWEVYHFKLFGEDRPPQIVDGELRTTFRNGDQETTITTEFVVTKALYGEDVVPGDIDPSLAPMPAPLPAVPVIANSHASSIPRAFEVGSNRDESLSEGTKLGTLLDTLRKAGKLFPDGASPVGPISPRYAELKLHSKATIDEIGKIIDALTKQGVVRLHFAGTPDPDKSVLTVHVESGIAMFEILKLSNALEPFSPGWKVDFAHDLKSNDVMANNASAPAPAVAATDPAQEPHEATAPRGEAAANVRVFALKNTRALDAAKIVEQLYSRALSVAVDERTNSLIVRGPDDTAEEVQSLLMRLDDGAGATTTSDSSTSPAPDPLDVQGARMTVPDSNPRPQVVDLSVSNSTQHGRVFSFDFGTTGPAPSELRQQYDSLERQAQSLSQGLRTPVKNPAQAGCTNCHDSTLGARPQLLDPMNCDELKSQLRDAVQQAFETRQQLQRAELAEFAQRLQGIQQSIEMREKIRQEIIERRVQELLDPNIKWDSLDAGIDTTTLSPPTSPASVNSAMASAAPMRAVSAKTVKIHALLFDVDEKAEPFDLSKIQHDAPDQLEVFLKAAAAKGQVNILSRPQLITRLNQEAMLAIGQTVALTKNVDQVTSSRDVGVKIAITPREESGKPVLKVNFDFSRIDPESNADDPDATPFIQSNSGELTVRMNEYGGKGKLLGPFQAVPGKNRFLHLIVTLTDEVPVSQIPPEVQGSWQFHEFAIVGDRNQTIPERFADAIKGRLPLVIDGEQMTRTTRDGTKTVYAIQYDSTTTPHRLTTSTFRGGQNRTQRYIVQIDPGFLRLASTTDGSQNFPKSFDEPRTLVETYKRVPTELARSDAGSEVNGSPKSSAAQPIRLDDLQGNWRLIINGQATGKNDGGKTERQVLDATIRGNRLTASTNPVQAAENEGQHANSPLQMILHLDGTGDPQPVDLEYVLEASEAAELEESIDAYALRNGKPIAQAIIERRGDGFRLCIEHAKIVGRPLAFELGETAILWELRPIDPADGKKAPDQPAAKSQSNTDMPENSPPLNNRVITYL